MLYSLMKAPRFCESFKKTQCKINSLTYRPWILMRNNFGKFFIFRNVLNQTTIRTFQLYRSYLIILTQSQQDISKPLSDAFGIVMKLGLLNVNILIKDERSMSWSLHFYKPFTHCHSFDIITIDTFTPQNYKHELNITSSKLFPTRKFQFTNCTIIVSLFKVEPYVIIKNISIGMTKYDGVEVTILNEVSKALNLNPKFIQRSRGIFFKNGTATGGALKMV